MSTEAYAAASHQRDLAAYKMIGHIRALVDLGGAVADRGIRGLLAEYDAANAALEAADAAMKTRAAEATAQPALEDHTA